MSRNLPVPIVNNAGEAVTFERQKEGNVSRGSLTLERGETYYEPDVGLTYETLVLKDSMDNFTNHVITMDELADDSYEKIEVTRGPNGIRLEKHKRTWTQRFSAWNPLKSRSRSDTLPTNSNHGHG